MKEPCCIHGAKSTTVVAGLSAKARATLVRATAAREGWAYATVRSGPDVRVITDSVKGPPVGETHMHLDVYEPAHILGLPCGGPAVD